MKQHKRGHFILLAALILLLGMTAVTSDAKTVPNGQTVNTALFYVQNSAGEQILVSELPVEQMETDMNKGIVDSTLHNYSILDRYVTPVHQEARGFTVGEFIDYAVKSSRLEEIQQAGLAFRGSDQICLWEIDQTGFDEMDTYTYDQLYGVQRYNFPLLYKYWDYNNQDYYDPEGKMIREEVIDYIFENGQPETVLLSVNAYSGRYIVQDIYGSGDFNMENYFDNQGLLDAERTPRFMKPMSKEDLYNQNSTASDSRYWCARVLLDMEDAPELQSQGTVAEPTAIVTEDDENYYVRFRCSTSGATIYYNSNFISPDYTPAMPYDGTVVTVPKTYFPSGTVVLKAQAVKQGCTDAGVVRMELTSSGREGEVDINPDETWENPFTDVSSADWFADAVEYCASRNYFSGTSATEFSPQGSMTRGMFVTVLGRIANVDPSKYTGSQFDDVAPDAWYAPYVAWASENGIVSGTGDGMFMPDGLVTREQMALILYNYETLSGEADVSGNISTFPDASSVSTWAENSMKWAVGRRIINGSDGQLQPQGTATRAQVAQIIRNYLG